LNYMDYEMTMQNKDKNMYCKSRRDKKDTEKENKVCAATSA